MKKIVILLLTFVLSLCSLSSVTEAKKSVSKPKKTTLSGENRTIKKKAATTPKKKAATAPKKKTATTPAKAKAETTEGTQKNTTEEKQPLRTQVRSLKQRVSALEQVVILLIGGSAGLSTEEAEEDEGDKTTPKETPMSEEVSHMYL